MSHPIKGHFCNGMVVNLCPYDWPVCYTRMVFFGVYICWCLSTRSPYVWPPKIEGGEGSRKILELKCACMLPAVQAERTLQKRQGIAEVRPLWHLSHSARCRSVAGTAQVPQALCKCRRSKSLLKKLHKGCASSQALH